MTIHRARGKSGRFVLQRGGKKRPGADGQVDVAKAFRGKERGGEKRPGADGQVDVAKAFRGNQGPDHGIGKEAEVPGLTGAMPTALEPTPEGKAIALEPTPEGKAIALKPGPDEGDRKKERALDIFEQLYPPKKSPPARAAILVFGPTGRARRRRGPLSQ